MVLPALPLDDVLVLYNFRLPVGELRQKVDDNPTVRPLFDMMDAFEFQDLVYVLLSDSYVVYCFHLCKLKMKPSCYQDCNPPSHARARRLRHVRLSINQLNLINMENIHCGRCRVRTYGTFPFYTLAMCCITTLPIFRKPPTLTSERKIQKTLIKTPLKSQ